MEERFYKVLKLFPGEFRLDIERGDPGEFLHAVSEVLPGSPVDLDEMV